MFCSGDVRFLYLCNGKHICQCKKCYTSFTDDMPNSQEIKYFYDGFNYAINEDSKKRILNKRFKKWFESFNLPKDAKMLDIGGGGGYFSLSFEKFGFGKATYIDLDEQACNYAKQLNIHEIINDDVCNLSKKIDKKYDFIYCRHVIEHLINPLEIIESAINLLSDNGVFILQFPNGLSFEYNFDKDYYEVYLKQIENENNFSKFEIYKILFSKKCSHAIFPIRHLWAISDKGMTNFLSKKNGITFKVKTTILQDKIYSPYYNGKSKLNLVIHYLLSKFNGGCHLIYKIKKDKSNFNN